MLTLVLTPVLSSFKCANINDTLLYYSIINNDKLIHKSRQQYARCVWNKNFHLQIKLRKWNNVQQLPAWVQDLCQSSWSYQLPTLTPSVRWCRWLAYMLLIQYLAINEADDSSCTSSFALFLQYYMSKMTTTHSMLYRISLVSFSRLTVYAQKDSRTRKGSKECFTASWSHPILAFDFALLVSFSHFPPFWHVLIIITSGIKYANFFTIVLGVEWIELYTNKIW